MITIITCRAVKCKYTNATTNYQYNNVTWVAYKIYINRDMATVRLNEQCTDPYCKIYSSFILAYR